MDNITDTGIQKSLCSRGGRTVCLQLNHMHNVHMQSLEICAKDILKKYKALDTKEHLKGKPWVKPLTTQPTA
jgi:hypothetical protein